jgi:hypothetical protein
VTRADTTAVVVTADSDTDGVFRISLEPGVYNLQPTNIDDAMLPHARELRVTVTAGQYQDLNILFDSGIRGIG